MVQEEVEKVQFSSHPPLLNNHPLGTCLEEASGPPWQKVWEPGQPGDRYQPRFCVSVSVSGSCCCSAVPRLGRRWWVGGVRRHRVRLGEAQGQESRQSFERRKVHPVGHHGHIHIPRSRDTLIHDLRAKTALDERN